MHILIEGYDGTGKSTLAELLSLATGWGIARYATHKPASKRELDFMDSQAVQAGIHTINLIQDRWPLISNHCYDGDTSITRVVTSLRLGRVDRVIHCDVAELGDLRVEPRPGDEADRLQTLEILPQAAEILARYRILMDRLRDFGFDVRRYTMKVNR